MVVSQLFEVTVAADGSEFSSKRVSKLSRRYHHHKKEQLRQSVTMAEVLSDAWVCPSCSHNNQDYQRCMGPGCDKLRPGSLLDTSEFALATQPPISNRRSTISVAKSHPAAAAARRSTPPPFPDESRWGALQRQTLPKTFPSFLAASKSRQELVYRLVPLLWGIQLRLLLTPHPRWPTPPGGKEGWWI